MSTTQAMQACPLCGAAVTPFRGDIQITSGARTVTVHSDHDECADCGERFYTPEQLQALEQRVSAALREADGLLSPAEIRSIRESLGLSQAGLEQLLGVGAKTVVRWERGTVVPNRATDNLLRVLHAVPGAVSFLRKRTRVGS